MACSDIEPALEFIRGRLQSVVFLSRESWWNEWHSVFIGRPILHGGAGETKEKKGSLPRMDANERK